MYSEAIPTLVIRNSSAPLSLATAAVVERHLVFDGVWFQRALVNITTAVVAGSPCVVAFKIRTAYGVTANAVTLATITIPGGATVGQTYYKEIDPKRVLPGQEIVVEVTTAATSGQMVPGIKMSHQSDGPPNIQTMIASA